MSQKCTACQRISGIQTFFFYRIFWNEGLFSVHDLVTLSVINTNLSITVGNPHANVWIGVKKTNGDCEISPPPHRSFHHALLLTKKGRKYFHSFLTSIEYLTGIPLDFTMHSLQLLHTLPLQRLCRFSKTLIAGPT